MQFPFFQGSPGDDFVVVVIDEFAIKPVCFENWALFILPFFGGYILDLWTVQVWTPIQLNNRQ